MKDSTFATVVYALLALTGAVSLMIVAPSHSALSTSCGQPGAQACR